MNRVMGVLTVLALLLTAGCSDDDDVGATPEALAAIALEHTGIEPTLVEGSTEDGVIRASIEFDNSHQRLSVSAKKDDGEDRGDPCEDSDDRGTCKVIETDAGDVALYWEDEEPEEDPGIVNVVFVTDDGVNVAHYAGDAITGDPRKLDLGVDVHDMVAIVTDDDFGVTTSKDLTDAEVPGWAVEPTELTPQVIAHRLTRINPYLREQAAHEVDAGEYGDGSIGATVEFDDGVTMTGYYVPVAERATVCPSGWACTPQQNGEILVGRPRNQVDDPARAESVAYRVVFLSDQGHAAIVIRDGVTLENYEPIDDMAHQASVMDDVDLVDAEDIIEINRIWEDR